MSVKIAPKTYVRFYTSSNYFYAVPEEKILGFSIGASINKTFPVGELIINDMDGIIMHNLGLNIGDFIFAVTADSEKDSKMIESPPFSIIEIKSLTEEELQKEQIYLDALKNKTTTIISGIFKIIFVHPWIIYNDNANKAYKGSSSDILWKIAGEAKRRGIKIEIGRIEKTDPSPDVFIRYKIDKTEIDFFKEDVLPFTTINKKPAYFFINDIGNLYLDNFINLFKATPRIMFFPPLNQISNSDSSIIITTEEMEDKTIIEVLSIQVSIGENYEDYLNRLYTKINLADPYYGTSFKVSHKTYVVDSGYTLVSKDYFKFSEGSSTTSYFERFISESLKHHIYKTKNLYSFFKVEILTEYCFGKICVGETAILNMEGISDGKSLSRPWLNGKYLVSETDHFKRGDLLVSKFTLIKPAILMKNTLKGELTNINNVSENVKQSLQTNCLNFEEF